MPQPAGQTARAHDPGIQEWERTYATFIHLTLLGNLILPIIILIAPLVMWLVKKGDSQFIDDHGKETVNFHISLAIYWLVIVPILTLFTCGVGAIGFLGVLALGIVGMIYGSIAANRGEYYRYPMCIRFIR